jgi:hypothetical protein
MRNDVYIIRLKRPSFHQQFFPEVRIRRSIRLGKLWGLIDSCRLRK